MTPTARNSAIAAAITVVPAVLAAAFYSDRARALPDQARSLSGRVSDRIRDMFEDESDVETATRRVVSRLEDLAHRLDRRESMMSRARNVDMPPAAAIGAGLAALVIIPTALTAIFAPNRLRAARDRVTAYWQDEEEIQEELSGLSERLDSLSQDIEKQRDANFDAVTQAAKKSNG